MSPSVEGRLVPFAELKCLIQKRRFRFGGQQVEVPPTIIKWLLLCACLSVCVRDCGESPLPNNEEM